MIVISALLLFIVYSITAPSNHSEAEDVYDFARRVEQGSFADQTGVNRVLALPIFGAAYKTVHGLGYDGRAFPFMIFINRLLSVLSVCLFLRLFRLACCRQDARSGSDPTSPAAFRQLPAACLLAFSYGFWRYANEAETYVLASVFVLGAWCLVLEGRWLWAVVVSAFGVLVHLLNLIPLLLVIPLYYLFSREWKRSLLHGGLTGSLVLLGYGVCSQWLDLGKLGEQCHRLEAGLSLSNLFRGGMAFGQCLVSGNFLFGFEGFRDFLLRMFPSRMLEEEFYMARHMPSWIPWAGGAALFCVAVIGLLALFRNRDFRISKPGTGQRAFFYACIAWFILYAGAVIHTEAGSPELWIMALIPCWLSAIPLLNKRLVPWLAALLIAHNLIAGLWPVMSGKSDYHAAKGRWLVEHALAEDLILTDYEPVMIFYLEYFTPARVVNSGTADANEIERMIGLHAGDVYAVSSFFNPMASMRVRSPDLFDRMVKAGDVSRSGFRMVEDDEFGGIWKWGGPVSDHE